jgi:hypothetical protein
MKLAEKILSKKASDDGIMGGAVLVGLTIILFIALLGLVSAPALAKSHGWNIKHSRHRYQPEACSLTASAAFFACQNEKEDDYWIAKGNCYNSDEKTRKCFREAEAAYEEAKAECQDQLDARKELCEELGEAPYDPEIDSDNFVKPAEMNAGNANPYFPLVRGNFWTYKTKVNGEITETNTDEVLTETKEIMGVECVVVHDIVYHGDLADDTVDHEIIEDTYDYYAQDIDGNVWYFGEFSLNFEEDLPSMEGSWIFGMDDAKPGIVMFADPLPEGVGVETVYRQEFALGDAEDWAKLESLDATASVPESSPDADFSCATGNNCKGTAEGTPLEPDVIEYKYYKPGKGTVLETTPDGERTELVSFTTH